MSPKDHIVFGAIASVALYPSMGQKSAYFWCASVAIDFDHYLDFVYHNRFTEFSLKKMFGYHKELVKAWHLPEFLNVELFHSIEFMAALYIISALTGLPALKAVLWGLIFHNALDMLFLLRNGIFFKRAYSLTGYLIKKRRLEAAGLRPGEVYSQALRAIG